MIKGIFQLAALAGFMLLPCFGYSQAPVLGASSNFALFSSNGAVTNTGLSQLTGNVGSNNGPVTNFGNVDGVMHNSDGATATAAADLTIAYNQLNAAIPTLFLASLLGNGQVLTAGIYSVGGGATLSNTLTLDGQGNSNALFIFQVGGAMSSGAASRVLLTNGAQACNVFWKVEGAVSFATNTSFKGTLVANNSAIVLSEGATIEGRALSTTGAITVSGVTVTTPLGCGRPVLNGPAAPPLASVACYTLFSGNGAVTNTGVSFITGDVGTNVGLATGFQALNVSGTVHPISDVSTAQAAADLGTVYTYLNTLPQDIELLYPAAFGNGLVLTPHTYLLDGATVLNGELTLNAQNNVNAVFVIKISGALSTSTYASVILLNGAQAKNVFWKVDGAVNLNDYADFKGTLVANNGAVALNTGVTLSGRALTTSGEVATFAINAQMTPGCPNTVGTSPNLTAVSIGRTTATACIATSINPIVRVRNIGNEDVSTYSVRFRVVSPSGTNITNVTRNRTPFGVGVLDSAALGTSVVLNQVGTYTISAVVMAAGDTVPANDSTGVRITVIQVPIPTVTGDDAFCTGGSTILTSSAITGNLWSNGATTRSITVSAIGNYSVRNIANGCTSATSIVVAVSVNAIPSIPTVTGDDSFCTGGSTILTSSAVTGNVWSNGETTRSITVNAAGNYSVRNIANGCTSATSNVVAVSITALPSTPTVTGDDSFCFGGNTTLTSSAVTGNLWSNGATNRSITVSAIGNYSVRNIANGCTSAVSNIVAVSVNPIPSIPTLIGDDAFCFGGSTILTSSATTGNLWSNGATTRSITVSAAGNYSVRNIANGCTSEVSNVVAVSVTALPSTPTAIGDDSFCFGGNTILTSSSATGNFWSNGATTRSITVNAAGNYSVRNITNGCTSAVSNLVAVSVTALPSIPTVTGDDAFCFGGNTILTSSAVTGNLWSNGATSRSITVSAAGNYSVRNIANGCTSAVSNLVAVSVTALPSIPTVIGDNSFCTGGNTTLTSSAVTGNLWSNGATTRSITVNAAGNYSVRNIANGCTSEVSNVVAVSVTALPSTPTVTGDDSFCTGGNTILTSSAITGNLWSNGSTSQSITVNSAGNYSVRNIANGCTSATSNVVAVSVNAIPTIPTLTGDDSFCFGGNTILTSSALTGNLWSNGATTRSITVSSAGNYSVRNVANGCTSATSNFVAVSVNPIPSIPTITGDDAFCFGGNTTLTSSSVTGNLWSNGATTRSIIVSAIGNYSVRNIANGCTSAVSNLVAVSVTALPSIPTVIGDNSFCTGGNTTLTSSSVTGNLWSNGATSQSITVSAAGNYSVRNMANGCTSAVSNIVAVSTTALPTTPTVIGDDSFCTGGNTTLTSSSVTGNLWSNGATSRSIIVSAAGNYSVRNIANGCTSANSNVVAVSVTALPSIPTITGDDSFCFGGNTTLTSSSPTGNLWSNGATTSSITVSAAGNYSVRNIANGCTSATSNVVAVSITASPSTPTVTGDDSFCFGENTTLTSIVVNGNLWSNGATSRSITVSSPGNYSVRNIANRCTSAVSNIVAVSVTALPSTPSVTGDDAFCFGGNTTLTSSAVTGNLWSNGATSQSITVSAAGNYSVRSVANGCTSATSNVVAVSVNPIPSIPTLTGDDSFCFGGNTILTSSAVTGNLWSNGDTTRSLTVSEAGNYSVRNITNGCTSATSNVVAISVTALPSTPTITGDDSFCFGGNTTLTSSSATNNLWSNGETTRSIIVSTVGNYSVRNIANGCTSATSVVVAVGVSTVPSAVEITANGPTSICFETSVVLAAPTGSSSYRWFNGTNVIPAQLDNTYLASASGVYTVQVGSGLCYGPSSNSISVVVAPAIAGPAITNSDPSAICEGQSTTITASGAASNATYIWSTGENTPSIVVRTAIADITVRSVVIGQCTSAASTAISTTILPVDERPIINTNGNILTASGTFSNGTVFEWLKDGRVILDNSTDTLNISSDANTGIHRYQVRSVRNNACKSDTSVSSVINRINSAVNRSNELKAYPIPTNNTLHISLPNVNGTKVVVRLIDNFGKEVYIQEVSVAGSLAADINVNHLPVGMYQLLISSETLAVSKTIIKK